LIFHEVTDKNKLASIFLWIAVYNTKYCR